MMSGRQRERFVKLLKLTHSSSDGEALAAIRKCNAMLVQQKLSWNDVVVERGAGPARSGPGETTASFREATRDIRASRAFEAAMIRERYLEQVCRYERAAAIQLYIGKTPILLRLIFFPLWTGAAMLAGVVVPETRASVRAMKWLGTLLLVAGCSVAWVHIFGVVVALL